MTKPTKRMCIRCGERGGHLDGCPDAPIEDELIPCPECDAVGPAG